MMDVPLTIGWMLEHAARNHGAREIVSREEDGTLARSSYASLARRVARLANALVAAGIGPGDRVASFAWNTHRHLELYYAVPMIGAVLHTANIRLFPEQIARAFEHADDRLVFVDASLVPVVARALALLPDRAPPLVVMGAIDTGALPPGARDYEAMLATQPETFAWPELDERAAAILCYTSATTGEPKGVLFTHRSSVLHALGAGLVDGLGVGEADAVLPVVPMFHVNAWGVPYLAALAGTKLVLPGARLDARSLIDLVASERVSVALGVPTVWLAVRDELERADERMPTLRRVVIGGSACPPALFDDLARRDIFVAHAWGMTELSPIGTTAYVASSLAVATAADRREAALSQGRFSPLVAWRLLDDAGDAVPHDGATPGSLWVRGPAVAASYYRAPGDPAFRDGWFLTGDVCTVDARGYLRVVDRLRDLVKSGGEWIPSVAVENALMGHPAVREAAVVGVAHARWIERPIAIVALRPEADVDESTLRAWLADRVAKWWVPDRIVFVDAIPRTGVGKFLKRDLRERYASLLHAVAARDVRGHDGTPEESSVIS